MLSCYHQTAALHNYFFPFLLHLTPPSPRLALQAFLHKTCLDGITVWLDAMKPRIYSLRRQGRGVNSVRQILNVGATFLYFFQSTFFGRPMDLFWLFPLPRSLYILTDDTAQLITRHFPKPKASSIRIIRNIKF